MPHPCLVRALALAFALPGLSATAGAGGRTPLPPVVRTLASHAECAAELGARAAADKRAVTPKSTTSEGILREVSLETKGIERLAAESLRYEATLWFHHGRPRAELGQVETSHSFDKVILECQGATLTTGGEKGFTLSTFEKAN